MIRALQAQMEELRQKSIANQLRNERLEGHEWEEQSHAPPFVPINPTPQPPPTLQTNQTHQSTRIHTAPDDEEDLRGHPLSDEIIEAPLPSKWKCLTIKLYDGSTNLDEHLNVFKT